MTADDLKDGAICAVVHLNVEPNPLSLQQVTLRPDKIRGSLIRLGETPGDEANCWQYLSDINIVMVLGHATESEGKWTVSPILEKAA
jgi:hypothetical protein